VDAPSPAPPVTTLAAISEGATTRRLRRNQVLFEPGNPADELFVVQAGNVAIVHLSADGRESLVSLRGGGELVGVAGLFGASLRSAQARALGPTTVLAMPYEPVRRMLEQHPELLWSVARLLSGRVRAAHDALADSAFLDLSGRIAKRMLEFAAGADEFQLPLTQDELAAMVGASRERVNKAIAGFARLGWLEQNGRRYRILDRQQLARRAQAGTPT
jgi:CRP-like cAMP-binding protein